MIAELAEQFSSLRAARCVRVFGGVKHANVYFLSLVDNARDVAAGFWAKTYAFKASVIVSASSAISDVLRGGCQPQICPSVIGCIAVAVINVRCWPFTRHNQPDQAVGTVMTSVKSDEDAPIGTQCSGWLAKPIVAIGHLLPRQEAGPRIVVETTANVGGAEVIADRFVSYLSHPGSIRGV